MGTHHGDRNEDRSRRDQTWSPYERDERGDRERERDRERGGWGMMDAARGDRGEIDDRYRDRREMDSGRFQQSERGGYGYGYGFDRFGGGGGQDSERWEEPRDYGYGRYDRGNYERYRGEGGQSGASSGNMRGTRNMEEQTGYRSEQYGRTGQMSHEMGRQGTQYGQPTGGHRGKGPAGYQRSDERIREDVSDMLAEDDDIDASGIEVQVKGCEVTLTGTVPDRRTKRMAEDLVERARGVKDVTNNLRVQQEQQKDQHTGNGSGRAQSVSNAADKDTDAAHRRPRA